MLSIIANEGLSRRDINVQFSQAGDGGRDPRKPDSKFHRRQRVVAMEVPTYLNGVPANAQAHGAFHRFQQLVEEQPVTFET